MDSARRRVKFLAEPNVLRSDVMRLPPALHVHQEDQYSRP